MNNLQSKKSLLKILKQRLFLATTLAFFLFCSFMTTVTSVLAHETAASDSIPFETVYANLLEKAANLNFEELGENSHNFKAHLLGSKKFIVVGPRTFIEIDSAFWSLADQISKLYLLELSRACQECKLPSVEQLQAEAQSLVAKGWFSERSSEFKEVLAFRYAGAFVTLGGRYGPAAGIIKLIGELMEEALLVVFKLPGAHIFCEVITTAIAIYAGKTNTFLRAFSYSKYSNLNMLSTPRSIARLVATSYLVRKSLSRIALDIPDFEIREQDLDQFVESEPESKLIYKITGQHRVRKFLNRLQKKSGQGDLDSTNFKVLKQKNYEGRRYGMTFLLKKRKKVDSLSEYSDQSGQMLRGTKFWVIGLQNDILDPLTDIKSFSENNNRPTAPQRFVESELFAEMTNLQKENFPSLDTAFVETLFLSLDKMTDFKTTTMKDRRLELSLFQSYMAGVLPKIMTAMLDSVLAQYSKEEKSLIKVYKLYYKLGQFYFYTEQFIDFLRFATVAKSSSDPFLKFHVREYFMRLNEFLPLVADFENSRTASDLLQMSQSLDRKLLELKADRFWIEKKSEIRFLPGVLGLTYDFLSHPGQVASTFYDYIKDLKSFGWISSNNDEDRAQYKKPKLQWSAKSCENLYL